MKLLLALAAGVALGATAIRLRSSSPAPQAVSPGSLDAGPGRVAVDVTAFSD